MVVISEINAEKDEARRQLAAAAVRSMTLVAPVDWKPYAPLLQHPFLEAIELGTWETSPFHHTITLLKQVGLRLGRGALETVYETGIVDVANRYAPLGKNQNSVNGLLQLVQHALTMAEVDRYSVMDIPGTRYAGRFEIAAEYLQKWVRKGLSLQEMFQGISLDCVYTDCFPYTHLHAWEKVHLAMRNMPGIYLSAPGRMSLTRLVFGWFKASRPYGRDHELELMNQIDLYSDVEDRYGKSEERIADLYEVRDLYHRRRMLDNKLRAAGSEPEIIELAPTLAILGGAMPRTYMLGAMDREVLHHQVANQFEQFRIELAEEPKRWGDDIPWRG